MVWNKNIGVIKFAAFSSYLLQYIENITSILEIQNTILDRNKKYIRYDIF